MDVRIFDSGFVSLTVPKAGARSLSRPSAIPLIGRKVRVTRVCRPVLPEATSCAA